MCKFWRAAISQNRSHDAIVSLLSGRLSAHSARLNFRLKFRFPGKFDVQTLYKPPNYVLGLIFVADNQFPRATYHTIVASTEELYCLICMQNQVL